MDICYVIGINNNTGIYNIIRNNMLAASSRGDKMQVIGGENNTIYQITKNKNELDLLENDNLSDNYTLSIIDLGECESILKEAYHLDDTDNLIILKKETLSDKSSEKDIQFEVFEPYNLTKLNLSLCLSTSINIYVKLELSSETEALNEELQKLGFNMFDINNRFYTDMCTPFKTSRKTDLILSDRIDDIYNNMDAQCQPNCQFSGYMFGSEYINCTCSVDIYEKKETVRVEKFKPKKLYESFIDVLKYSNYKILKCYKLIGSKRMITKNIGNIMLIILFIVYIYSLTSYICRGVNPLRNRLIEEGIKDENDEEKYLSTEGIKRKSTIMDDKGKNKKKKDKKRKSKNKHNPPKKTKNKKFSVLERNKKKNKELRKLDKLETNVDNYKYPKRSINIIFNQRKDSNEDMLISQEPKKEEKATKNFQKKKPNKLPMMVLN